MTEILVQRYDHVLSPNSGNRTRLVWGAPMSAYLPPEVSRLATLVPSNTPQGYMVLEHHVVTPTSPLHTSRFTPGNGLARPGTAKLAKFAAQNHHLIDCREPTKNFQTKPSTVLECSRGALPESALTWPPRYHTRREQICPIIAIRRVVRKLLSKEVTWLIVTSVT